MTSAPLDPQGEASRALATAIEDFGPRALSSPVVLANLFKDLLPDSPRETTVLVAVAEAGLAKGITDRIDQGLPPDSATYQAATIVAEARAMDPAAVHWAARQFAGALGYHVAPSPTERAALAGSVTPDPAVAAPRDPNPWAKPAPPATPGWPASAQGNPADTIQGVPAAQTAPGIPPAAAPPFGAGAGTGEPRAPGPAEVPGTSGAGWGSAGWGTPAPAAGAATPSPAPAYPGGPAYPGAPTPGAAYGNPPTSPWSARPAAAPPGGPWTPPKGQGRSRGPWYLGAAAAIAVIAAIVVVIAVSGGGSHSSTTTTVAAASTTDGIGTSTTSPVTSATTSTTSPSNLSAAETKLAAVLPVDLDPQENCSTSDDPPDGLTDLSAALSCGAPAGLPDGNVFAYQFPTPATFTAGLAQYNKDKAYDPATAGKACPPASADEEGLVPWHNPSKTLSGSLECLTLQASDSSTVTMPAYIWTITQDNAIVEAIGSSSATFAQLNAWFAAKASPR